VIIDPAVVAEFLDQHRIAVVGASADPREFSNTVYRELRGHGYEVVAVNPKHQTISDDPCYPDLVSVPGTLDGVIVMVHRDKALDIVTDCHTLGIPRVWLFKGLGGAGAASEKAVALCDEYGVEVVAGACPLMFLEPVGWFHRLHRAARRANGSLASVG
jgi:predicted CoA-binding protein